MFSKSFSTELLLKVMKCKLIFFPVWNSVFIFVAFHITSNLLQIQLRWVFYKSQSLSCAIFWTVNPFGHGISRLWQVDSKGMLTFTPEQFVMCSLRKKSMTVLSHLNQQSSDCTKCLGQNKTVIFHLASLSRELNHLEGTNLTEES